LDPGGTEFVHLVDTDFPTDITVLYTRLGILGEDGKIINIDKGLIGWSCFLAGHCSVTAPPDDESNLYSLSWWPAKLKGQLNSKWPAELKEAWPTYGLDLEVNNLGCNCIIRIRNSFIIAGFL
jgi:hypothetical protein